MKKGRGVEMGGAHVRGGEGRRIPDYNAPLSWYKKSL